MLQQRSNLVLGLVYFESGKFEEALHYLMELEAENENYPKALLSLGWCYVKLEQFQNVIEPLENLLNRFPDHHLIPEAYILLGQAHLKIRLFDKAIFYFTNMLNLFSSKMTEGDRQTTARKQLSFYEKQIESQRLDLVLLETKLLDMFRLLSDEGVPEYMILEVEGLKTRRSQMLDQIQFEKSRVKQADALVKRLNRKLNLLTKNWHSYAEYGISRALFLKEWAQ